MASIGKPKLCHEVTVIHGLYIIQLTLFIVCLLQPRRRQSQAMNGMATEACSVMVLMM